MIVLNGLSSVILYFIIYNILSINTLFCLNKIERAETNWPLTFFQLMTTTGLWI